MFEKLPYSYSAKFFIRPQNSQEWFAFWSEFSNSSATSQAGGGLVDSRSRLINISFPNVAFSIVSLYIVPSRR